MKRSLTVVLFIVALFVSQIAAQTITVTGGTDQDLRDLIARYVGGFGGTQDVSITVGSVPSELPLSIPLPPNTRVLATIVRNNFDIITYAADARALGGLPTKGTMIEIIYDTQEQAGTLAQFVREFVAGNPDLTEFQFNESKPSGFNTNSSFYAAYCYKGTEAGVNFDAYSDGITNNYNVRITLPSEVYMCGDDANSNPPYFDVMSELMPALALPAGVTIVPQTANVFYASQDAVNSQATLLFERPMVDVFNDYTAQLEAAGWVRKTSESGDSFAYSTWTVGSANNREWVGTFTIAVSPQNSGYNAVVTVEPLR